MHKPLVSDANKAIRLAWCRERKDWTVDDWRKVIWSDESKFIIFNHARSTRVWRKVSEKYKVDCLVPTVKSNANGVMVWGCFRGGEVGPLAMVDGTINSDGYIKIWRKILYHGYLIFWMKMMHTSKMIMLLSTGRTRFGLGRKGMDC